MQKFTGTNTKGYSSEQLTFLNEVYFKTIATLDKSDKKYKQQCEEIAELILKVVYK